MNVEESGGDFFRRESRLSLGPLTDPTRCRGKNYQQRKSRESRRDPAAADPPRISENRSTDRHPVRFRSRKESGGIAPSVALCLHFYACTKRRASLGSVICQVICWMLCNNCSSCLICRQVRASRSPNQRPASRIRTRYYYHYRLSYLPLSATIDYYRYRLPLLPLPLPLLLVLLLLLLLLLPIVLRLLLNEPNETRVSYNRRDLARRGT